MKSFAAADDEYFAYFEPGSAKGFGQAVDALGAYITSEGPFDGVIGFSQGALLASTFIARMIRQNPQQQQTDPVFKFAIFFSGGVPVDYDALSAGEIRLLDAATEGEIISIPTTNIWGANDRLWPGRAIALSEMCKSTWRTVYIHDGGHEIPNSKSKTAVTSIVHAIRRTVDNAMFAQ